MILRYFYYFRHSFDRMSDTFYWPTIDLLLFGLTSVYISKYAPKTSMIVLVMISGVILWIAVWRGQYEISVNLLEELWNNNLINIFTAPIKFSECIISLVIVGVLEAVMGLVFAMGGAYFLYHTNLFNLGFYLLPFIFLLLMTGWAVGFFVAGVILRYGTRVQFIAWSLIAVISPFSALYYPLSVLPQWAQDVARFIPTSYIFEGAREIIYKGHLSLDKIYWSLGLNLIYLTLGFIFLRLSFDKVLQKGMKRVY
jgi:ABC-2 type transport system permease protein